MARKFTISGERKKNLREKLYKRDGYTCRYCGIKEEDFLPIWGYFYNNKNRGPKLEIDRKDNNQGYSEQNCVLACPICNNAKSDKFTSDEFAEVGKAIKKIWKKNKTS